jgi:hypothetical protein
VQVRFQIGNGARRVGGRRVQMLRGRGEAAGLDDAHEDAHVLKRIHTHPFVSLRRDCCTFRNADYLKRGKNALHPYGLFDNPPKNIIDCVQ